jgi:hypothetical protein
MILIAPWRSIVMCWGFNFCSLPHRKWPFFQCGGVKFPAEPHIVHRTPDSELWLAEFADADGNQLALMSQTTSVVA